MKRSILALIAATVYAAPLFAQKPDDAKSDSAKSATRPIKMQHFRPQDQRGVNMFEAPKNDKVPFNGFVLDWGAAFSQTYQNLKHENTADPKMVNNVDQNKLMTMGQGFNLAAANLYLNAQLAPGIRLSLTSYLSSRHHNETWVKDGYLLMDESPIDVALLNNVMKYVTVKAGHFEINYGDTHFRRSDNGNGIYNPFVGNYILDPFTTEIGGEMYVRANGFMVMQSVTGGEIKGNTLKPADRSPAYINKIGYDKQFSPNFRFRLTGSQYRINKSPGNTLFAGDRAGSRYFYVMENTAATVTANASSGLVNPGFNYKVKAQQINPFVQVGGLELFGVAEKATGRTAAETKERTWNQYAGDAVYRFGKNDGLFVGGRYNVAKGTLAGMTDDVNVNRTQLGGGWFLTPNVLIKGEFVRSWYKKFPASDIRNGGKFRGLMIESAISF
jgi:hypothetical protein